jgi:hypothetical protein
MADMERRMDMLLTLMSREPDFILWEAKGNPRQLRNLSNSGTLNFVLWMLAVARDKKKRHSQVI